MEFPRKRICLLGSTGSIGQKTLQVCRDYPDRFQIVGLSAHGSAPELARQVAEFGPEAVCLSGEGDLSGINGKTRRFRGAEGLIELIEASRPDVVVVSTVGIAGLLPTLAAIGAGATIALANKEVLVTAGDLVMSEARRRSVAVLPIDSEHNAIFQCLDGRESPLRRIVLTASGGPFRGWPRERLEAATVEMALKHPTWNMGRKITIDSATLMNKGFEVIEAKHLFGIEVDRIEVTVHPQSVIHSMIEFHDGSMIAQLGVTDMYFPIANVLAYPERLENRRFHPLDLASVGRLDFEDYDREAFPCLGYAYEAARRGGTYPAAMNAANEIAVQRFLAGDLRFTEIAETIDRVLQAHNPSGSADLEAIQETNAWAREQAAAGSNTVRVGMGRRAAD